MASEPVITSGGGIFTFTWPNGLVVRVDRVREASSGSVTGEIKFLWETKQVHQARLNMLAPRSIAETAKRLEELQAGADWKRVVERVCEHVLALYRRGDPPVVLKDVQPEESEWYRLRPLLLDRSATVLYGLGGIGKSFIGQYFAVLLDNGYVHNGLTPEPGKVLALDYETSETDWQRRIAAIHRGLDLSESTSGIVYRYMTQPFADDLEEIQSIVAQYNIQYLVIDSLGAAIGDDLEKAQGVHRCFDALRVIKCGALFLHHENKEGAFYGNVYVWNRARSVYRLKGTMDEGTLTAHVALFHEKANETIRNKPAAFRLSFQNAPDGRLVSLTVATQNIADIPALEESLDLKYRIENVLKTHGPLGVGDIANELGKDAMTVKTTLNRWNNRMFVNIQRGQHVGQWALNANHKNGQDDGSNESP